MNDQNDKFDEMLQELMQESGLDRAPANFTQSVMRQISASPSPAKAAWKPLISKKGWFGIGIGLVAMAIAVLISKPSAYIPGQKEAERAMDQFMGYFHDLQIPTILVLTLTAVVVLFSIDRILGARKATAK